MRRKPAQEVVGDNVAEPLTVHDRETLSGLVDDYRSGQTTRRSFLRNSTAFGLSMTSLSALLAACSNPDSATQLRAGGTGRNARLAIAVSSDADTLDPQAFKTIPGYYMLANLYDPIYDFAGRDEGRMLLADGRRLAPATARPPRISADKKTVTLELEPAARFSDGTPVGVDDLVYTLQRGVEGTQYTKLIMGMLTLSGPGNIKTVGRRGVALTLDKPNPMAELLLPLQVLSIQSKRVGERHATPKDKWADTYWRAHVYGSGAYTLGQWTRGTGWDLLPNRHYYRPGLPRNGGLLFRIITNAQERLNLLKAGTLHVAYDIAAKDAAAIRESGDSHAALVSRPSPWSFGLTFNCAMPPFTDRRVRQALSSAVPYQAIIDEVMFRLARPAKSIVPPGMPTHDPSAWHYDTDLRKAKQLLEAAGHGNGFQSSIDVLIGRPEDEQAAILIQANFQKLGVQVDVVKLDDAQYQQNRNAASSPMQIVEWYSWVNDPFFHMFWNVFSKNTFTNSARYANPAVDKLLLGGLYETNAAKRADMSRAAQRLVTEDAPWAFLFARDFFVPVSPRLRDYPLWPDQNPRFYWSRLT
jgi:peptide/nickel transport system substrate-binding protein